MPRCDEAMPGVCDKAIPALVEGESDHAVRCFLHHKDEESVESV
jgi:hypothetical protein